MKKIASYLTIISLLLITFSCGGGGSGSAKGVSSVTVLASFESFKSKSTSQKAASSTLTNIRYTVTGSGMDIMTDTVPVTGNLVEFTLNVPNGPQRLFVIEALDSSNYVRYKGEAYRDLDGTPVTIEIILLIESFLILDLDGDDDGIFNEESDFILFESPSDNQVIVRATVFNQYGQRVFGSVVTFGSDIPYKVRSSTTCSDGSTSCEVSFPLGNTATTNIYGEAFVLVQVDPLTIRNVTTILNITASADNGAANMVSLFLQPVVMSTVTLSANPAVIEPEDTSTITAAVTLSTGGPAFDSTVVSFTTTCGSVTPFAQTTDGAAEATFTAPSTEGTCTITATAGGASDSVDVLVIRALTVIPTTQTISNPAVNDSGTYTIIGGTAPYQAFSDNPALVTVAVAGSVVTATVASVPTDDTTVTITIHDSIGDSVLALLILDI